MAYGVGKAGVDRLVKDMAVGEKNVTDGLEVEQN